MFDVRVLSAARYLEGQEDEQSDVIHLIVNTTGEGSVMYFVSDEADLWIQVHAHSLCVVISSA